jgi:hypothetical protein
LHGEFVARWDGKPDDDHSQIAQTFRKNAWRNNARALAQAMLDGRNVTVVPYHASTAAAVVVEVKAAALRIIQHLIDGYEKDGRIVYDDVPMPAAAHVTPYRGKKA